MHNTHCMHTTANTCMHPDTCTAHAHGMQPTHYIRGFYTGVRYCSYAILQRDMSLVEAAATIAPSRRAQHTTPTHQHFRSLTPISPSLLWIRVDIVCRHSLTILVCLRTGGALLQLCHTERPVLGGGARDDRTVPAQPGAPAGSDPAPKPQHTPAPQVWAICCSQKYYLGESVCFPGVCWVRPRRPLVAQALLSPIRDSVCVPVRWFL